MGRSMGIALHNHDRGATPEATADESGDPLFHRSDSNTYQVPESASAWIRYIIEGCSEYISGVSLAMVWNAITATRPNAISSAAGSQSTHRGIVRPLLS